MLKCTHFSRLTYKKSSNIAHANLVPRLFYQEKRAWVLGVGMPACVWAPVTFRFYNYKGSGDVNRKRRASSSSTDPTVSLSQLGLRTKKTAERNDEIWGRK